MRKLHTELKAKPFSEQMSIGQSVLTVGSCFAQVMGEQLSQYKFDCLVNPMGTLFNPISISKILSSNDTVDDKRIVERDRVFFHYDYHSDLRADTQANLIQMIKDRHDEIQSFVKRTDWVIITLGTAFVYELKNDQSVVANCHKVPQNLFKKRLLSLDEMLASYEHLFTSLNNVNPNLKIILTVSPVRHVKDGISENQMSKSLLRVLCGLLENKEGVSYFPAYEIMMDELRDYRYYKDDMLHPSNLAEEIIWEKFMDTAFDNKTMIFQKEWKTILSALSHRPFNPKYKSHQDFIKKQLERLSKLDNQINVSKEVQLLESQLV